jgi:hypothetical protein
MNVALARGFYTWKETLHNHKTKSLSLKNVLTHWKRNSEYKAFKKWIDAHHNNKKEELQTMIMEQEEGNFQTK